MNLANKGEERYVQLLMKFGMLGKEEEKNLWKERDSLDVVHKIIKTHAKIVVKAAYQYKKYALPVEDLIQEGLMGLMKAAQKYDDSQNARFSTYAKWWVKAGMQHFILNNWSMVRAGSYKNRKKIFTELEKLRSKMKLENQGEHEDFYGFMHFSKSDISLNSPIYADSDEELQSYIKDTELNPEERYMLSDLRCNRREWIDEMLSVLNALERQIIHYRYLDEDKPDINQIAQILDMDVKVVRKLGTRAIRKLYAHLKKNTCKIKNY